MALTAEFQLRSPELPLVDVAAAVPDLTFQLVDDEQTQSGPAVFFVRATSSSFDGVDAAFSEALSVKEYFLISEVGSTRAYQVVLGDSRSTQFDELTFKKMFPERVTIISDGWYIKQQFANRDEFAAYRELCRSIDFTFHLDRLYDSTSTDTDLIGLSNKQREALLTAYEEGYFDVPQQVSLDDVATTLNISGSALVERLHRAQSHLIEHFFYADLY